jgi:hypothetical protein
MNDSTATLVELRKYYQRIVAQAELSAADANNQIAHIDALLVNGLMESHVPTVAIALSEPPSLALAPAVAAELESHEPASEIETLEVKQKGNAKTLRQPKPKGVERSTQKREISLLPAYAGLNKLEAITKVLNEQAGQVLHQDTITQLLYGDLSPEEITEARRKMKASLYQGTTKELWQKAPKERSSYWVPSVSGKQPQKTTEVASAIPTTVTPSPTAQGPERKGNQRKSKAMASSTPTKSPSRGRAQILALPTEYEGLSKIDAVSKVLQETPGQVVHIDAIIAKLYGTLSPEALAAERVRMKDVIKRGIERKLWQKAPGIPSSIVLVEASANSAGPVEPKPTARKPRGSVTSKSKASDKAKPNQPKRKQAEMVALLKKGGVNV